MRIRGGKDMKKTKHFAHYPNFTETKAHYESYIHQAWKKRIKEQFDSSTQFVSQLYVYKPWEKKVILHTLDLKERFDTCEMERGYDGFIPDLKLSNSKHPEWDAVFIEIFYKHECSREKKESGIKIIEIKVDDDKEKSLSLKEGGSMELNWNDKTANPYVPTNIPNIRFYNFPRVLQPPLGRFSVCLDEDNTPVGKYKVLNDYWSEANLTHDAKSLMEITVSADKVAEQKEDYMKAFYATALKNKIPVGYCKICTVYKSSFCPFVNSKYSVVSCNRFRISPITIERYGQLLKKITPWINSELVSTLKTKVVYPF